MKKKHLLFLVILFIFGTAFLFCKYVLTHGMQITKINEAQLQLSGTVNLWGRTVGVYDYDNRTSGQPAVNDLNFPVISHGADEHTLIVENIAVLASKHVYLIVLTDVEKRAGLSSLFCIREESVISTLDIDDGFPDFANKCHAK